MDVILSRSRRTCETSKRHTLQLNARFLPCNLLQHIDSCDSALISIKIHLISVRTTLLVLSITARVNKQAGPWEDSRGRGLTWAAESLGRSAAAPVRMEQGLPGLPQSLPIGALGEQDAQSVPPTLLPCGSTYHHEVTALWTPLPCMTQ